MGTICTFGEILLRIAPEKSGEKINQTDIFRITAAGSEANVAVALSNLGKSTRCISIISNDIIGDKIMRKIRESKVDVDYIAQKSGSTGIFWNENGLSVRASDVIYDRAHSLFAETLLDKAFIEKALEGATWLHASCISPAVSKIACDNTIAIVEMAAAKGIAISTDLNFRKKLWKWTKSADEIKAVYEKIASVCTCIIGNESDYQDSFGISGEYDYIAKQIFDRFPNVKYIAASNREAFSASDVDWSGRLFTRENGIKEYLSNKYILTSICDRVGTGDSFASGIIYGLNTFEDKQKTVNFAVALSALNHTTIGDFSYFTIDDVEKTINSGGNGRILR